MCECGVERKRKGLNCQKIIINKPIRVCVEQPILRFVPKQECSTFLDFQGREHKTCHTVIETKEEKRPFCYTTFETYEKCLRCGKVRKL